MTDNTFTHTKSVQNTNIQMETNTVCYAIDDRGMASNPRSNKRRLPNTPETERQLDESFDDNFEDAPSMTPFIGSRPCGSNDVATPTSHNSISTRRVVSRGVDTDVNSRLDEMMGMIKDIWSIKEDIRDLKNFKLEMREELREWRSEVSCFLNSVKNELRDEIREVDDTVQSVVEKMNEYEEKVVGIEAHVKSQSEAIQLVQREMGHIDRRSDFIEHSMIDKEANDRRSNLIIYGVSEREGENCVAVVGDLARRCGVRDPSISKVHRIGRQNRDNRKPRGIIVTFSDTEDRQKMKRNRKQLPREISLADDLPGAVREARKLLLADLKNAKSDRKEAWLVYPAKLFIENILVKSVDVVSQRVTVHEQAKRDPIPREGAAPRGIGRGRGASEDERGAHGHTRVGRGRSGRGKRLSNEDTNGWRTALR